MSKSYSGLSGLTLKLKCPDFDFEAEGFGASYKNAVKKGIYGLRLTGFGESLARMEAKKHGGPWRTLPFCPPIARFVLT